MGAAFYNSDGYDGRRGFCALQGMIAALITVVAAIIPWLIVIVPVLWFLIKAIRRFRDRRRALKPVTPAV